MKRILNAADRQLSEWQLARDNYSHLSLSHQKHLKIGDSPLILQHNPARIVSTGAKLDADNISKRPCFLCSCNRPCEQFVLESFGPWQVLLNPYPIFNYHFTIVHTVHQHQDNIDFADMAHFASSYRGLTAFYNASASGASCPDHLHFQAVRSTDIPLCGFLESNPGKLLAKDSGCMFYLSDETAAAAIHIVSDMYTPLVNRWLNYPFQSHIATNRQHQQLRNILMWCDIQQRLHTLLFLRSKHRPACFYAEDESKRLVSPGAIDMAQIIILPRREDFDRFTAFDAGRVLDEVSFDPRDGDALKTLLTE